MNYLLYNPLSNNGKNGKGIEKTIKELNEVFPNIEEVDYTSITFHDFAHQLQPDDNLVIAGGDGTLNFFGNDYQESPHPEVNYYLYPSGTGNDFVNDIKEKDGEQKLYKINKYIEKLPKVRVNGKDEVFFINNVGYGLDGVVCEVAEDNKAKGKKVNYTSIAISLLMGKYECRDATVTVDGVTKEFKRVWVCPAMNGKYYGGGMKAAPSQDRLSGKITCAVMFGQSRLHTVKAFTGIFKGNHVKHTEMIEILEGKHIEVTFNSPCALQVDGELYRDVTHYEAWID